MFHWQDGWFFERLYDGTVRIEKRKDAKLEGELIASAEIPAHQWASIVAAVSVWGDHNPFYEMARVFHGILPDEPIKVE